MAPELFPSVPGMAASAASMDHQDKVNEKVGGATGVDSGLRRRQQGAMVHCLWSAAAAFCSSSSIAAAVGMDICSADADVHANRRLHRASSSPPNPHPWQVDVFSFGVVLWEIWTLGEQPYPTLSLHEIFAGVMTGNLRPAIPPDCEPAWAALMQDCWQGKPRARPTFGEVAERLELLVQQWSPAAAAAEH